LPSVGRNLLRDRLHGRVADSHSLERKMLRGSCLCGGARFEIEGEVTPIECCHCSRCRKASGSAFVPAIAVRTENFRWVAGQDLVTLYEALVREKPPPYRKAFCRRCGSPLPIVDRELPSVEIPAGALDDDPGTRPLRHIFVGARAPWFSISDELLRYPRHVPDAERLPTLLPVR
jgi:hypothetical protein